MFQRSSWMSRLTFATALSILIIVLFALLAMPTRAAIPLAATNTADIVVQFGDGSIITRHITFTGTISGLEALRRTGLALVEKNGAVCRIEDTGCVNGQDCFCACAPPAYTPCLYWSYQQWDGSAWQASAQGAGATTVTNGAVEGWTWGRALPPMTGAVLGAQAGLQWLKPLQNADGSYGNTNNSTGSTIDTLLANRAMGGDAAAWQNTSGYSLLDALSAHAADYAARNNASLGKLMLGVAAADSDPRHFAGLDLVISATTTFDSSTGAYGSTNWDQALSILGLRAAGASVPSAAINLLKSRANADGGWSFTATGTSDVDSTGLVLQALASAGVDATDPVIVQALAYLDTLQLNDGGFPYDADPSNTSNANSTALAVQGILASKTDPLAARWQPVATNPISYLLGLQTSAGAFTYGGQESLLATQQVIPALAGRPFPYASRAVVRRLGLNYIGSQLQADGSFAGFGVGSSIDAILAIDAAGGIVQDYVSTDGKRPLDYLATQAASYAANSAAATGKLIVGIVAADGDPRNFAGLNLVISATQRYNPNTGAFGTSTFDQAWSILGLAAAGQSVPLSATARLQAIQATGGGWGFDANAAVADSDSSGLALQALALAEQQSVNSSTGVSTAAVCTTAAGSNNPAALAALAFLRSVENGDGGFPGYDGQTSASSTGLVLQGLAAYHDDPRSLSWSTVITDGTRSRLTLYNPVDSLLALQTDIGGFPGYSGPNDPAATYQALPGVLGQPFPSSKFTLIYLPSVSRN